MTGQAVLKRLIAAAGLMLMLPIGIQLVSGSLTPSDAAVRAGAIFLAVFLGRSMANFAPDSPVTVVPVEQMQPGRLEN